jgi:hypothetical protein
MLAQGPSAVMKLITSGGHDNVPLDAGKFEIAAAKNAKQTVDSIKAERGHMYLHKVRQTKVCILKPGIDLSASGDVIHLVVESRSGKKFKALNRNLEEIR